MKEARLLLQLAIDDPGHIGLVSGLADLVDIIEVGTPLLKRFGLAAVATLKQAGGGRPILVDSKTVDGGAREARMLFEEGAAFVTVLSMASPATHQARLLPSTTAMSWSTPSVPPRCRHAMSAIPTVSRMSACTCRRTGGLPARPQPSTSMRSRRCAISDTRSLSLAGLARTTSPPLSPQHPI